MPSVIVVLKGQYGSGIEGGDITSIYEGIPYATNIPACYADVLGKVHSYDAGDDGSHEDDTVPLNNVTVSVTTTVASTIIAETTNSTGDYEVEEVSITPENNSATVTFSDSQTDYLTGTLTIEDLTCGEDEVLDCELLCMVNITATLMSSDVDAGALSVLGSADVNYSMSLADLDAACGYSTTYNGLYADTTTSNPVTGLFIMTVPLLDRTLTFTVTHPTANVIETRVFTKTIMDYTGGGSVGSALPRPSYTDVPTYTIGPFTDDDCAWNPNAVRTRGITDTVTCAYSQVTGRVCADTGSDGGCDAVATDPPYIGETVTATRVEDSQVIATTTTDTNGNYILTLPAGVAPENNTVLNGNEYRITVGATTINIEFTGCGQSFTDQDFAF